MYFFLPSTILLPTHCREYIMYYSLPYKLHTQPINKIQNIHKELTPIKLNIQHMILSYSAVFLRVVSFPPFCSAAVYSQPFQSVIRDEKQESPLSAWPTKKAIRIALFMLPFVRRLFLTVEVTGFVLCNSSTVGKSAAAPF